MQLDFSQHILKINSILNFMKIRAVGAELFCAEARTGGTGGQDRNDEDNTRLLQFCKCAKI